MEENNPKPINPQAVPGSNQPAGPIPGPIPETKPSAAPETPQITTPSQATTQPSSEAITTATQPSSEAITTAAQPSPEPTITSQPVAGKSAKKKTGLIVGLILGVLALVGGTAAAVMLLMPKASANPVSTAMERIMSGQTSSNVAIDGEINLLNNDTSSPLSRVNIKLDSDISVGSMINTSSAVLTLTSADGKDASIEVEEVYADGGNLYFKVEGLGNIADLELDSSITSMIDMFTTLDGNWIRLNNDSLSTTGVVPDSSTISCVTNLVTDLDKTKESTSALYQKYPFISSTTDGVVIPKKQSQVYQISINSDNLAKFVSEIQNSKIVQDAYACLGSEDAPVLTSSDIAEITSKMPKVYAEVNNNNDFSRLYLESDINDGAMSATIDLNFNYIDKVTATEPVEYTDFTTFIQRLMSNFYVVDDTTTTVIENQD